MTTKEEYTQLLDKFADLKILADNLKKENKKLRKLLTEQREKFVADLKERKDSWEYCGLNKIYTGTVIEDYNELQKKWEGVD